MKRLHASLSTSIVSKPNNNINAMKAGRHAFQALFTYELVCTPFEDCLCIRYLCVNVIYNHVNLYLPLIPIIQSHE